MTLTSITNLNVTKHSSKGNGKSVVKKNTGTSIPLQGIKIETQDSTLTGTLIIDVS